MKHLPLLTRALSLGLLSFYLITPLAVQAKTKTAPPPLQCERDGRLQNCDDNTSDTTKPNQATAFKAQAPEQADLTNQSGKKNKKKGKKATKKKAKRNNVAE